MSFSPKSYALPGRTRIRSLVGLKRFVFLMCSFVNDEFLGLPSSTWRMGRYSRKRTCAGPTARSTTFTCSPEVRLLWSLFFIHRNILISDDTGCEEPFLCVGFVFAKYHYVDAAVRGFAFETFMRTPPNQSFERLRIFF